MLEVTRANGKKLPARIAAPDRVQEILGLLQTLTEKVHVFFHLLHLSFLRNARGANRLVEFRDVTQNLAPSRQPRFASLKPIADL